MIGVIDIGFGNSKSLTNVFEYLGQDCKLVQTVIDFEDLDKIVFPGVGSFDAVMGRLESRKLIEPLQKCVMIDRLPYLGICLGMQVLGRSSTEGKLNGLGFLSSESVNLSSLPYDGKIPHMGWSDVIMNPDFKVFKTSRSRFYFAHSYAMKCDSPDIACGFLETQPDICVSVRQDNIFGVQFHPEKSHKFGLNLLNNFAIM